MLAGEEKAFDPFVQGISWSEGALSAFKSAEVFRQSRLPGRREACFMELYNLIYLLKKEAAKDPPNRSVMDRLAPALAYIEEHYTEENIPVSRLAELCSVSEEYLRRLFHSAFSVSPSVYIRNMRLRHAEDLLRSNEYSVSQAALLSGFSDVSYFSREFKKATGVSPRRYAGRK